MNTWADGYNTDTNYLPLCMREISPAMIDLALLKAGYRPPSSENKTYCELGCGYGYTSLIMAACYPEMTFYAIDFNSEHIATAKEFVKQARLENIHFLDASFEEFYKTETPKFDYITLHGVWSWISEGARADVTRIIREKLNPGGAVYISYNAMPGCAPYVPMKKLYYDLYKNIPGTIKDKVTSIMNFVDKFMEKEVGYFQHSPSVPKRHANLKDKSHNYFAHEYLNENWKCFFLSEVSNQFAEAKLTFACSGNLSEVATTTLFEKDFSEFLPYLSGSVQQEEFKDIVQNKMFRRDLFVRGPVRLSALELVEKLNSLKLYLHKNPKDYKSQVSVDGQIIQLPEEGHKKIMSLLEAGPKTFGDLQKDSLLGRFPYSHLLHIVCCCLEAGQIIRLREDIENIDYGPAERLNKYILDLTRYNNGYNYFAMPEFGYGLECGHIDQLFFKAVKDGKDPVQEALAFLRVTRESLRKHGREITDPQETLTLLREAVQEFRKERLPFMEKIKIAA